MLTTREDIGMTSDYYGMGHGISGNIYGGTHTPIAVKPAMRNKKMQTIASMQQTPEIAPTNAATTKT